MFGIEGIHGKVFIAAAGGEGVSGGLRDLRKGSTDLILYTNPGGVVRGSVRGSRPLFPPGALL